jgi:hypothetical protein
VHSLAATFEKLRSDYEELVSSDKDNTKRDAVLEERFNGLKAGAYTRPLFGST